ncbi:tetratricopeptide repeat protein [Treponema sp.]|uniref:tetratricopeptide repeat protein n=1 Tax=Treponema sp. TaxID=166 RepID=UPI003890EC71
MKKIFVVLFFLFSFSLFANEVMDYINQSEKLYNQGNTKTALEKINSALKIAPENLQAITDRSVFYIDLGNYDLAFDDAQKALSIDENDLKAHYCRGVAYYYLKNFDKALEDFNFYLKQFPEHPTILNFRGLTYMELSDYKKAEQDFSLAIAFGMLVGNFRLDIFCNNHARAFIALEDFESAVKELDKAIIANPFNAEYYTNRSFCYNKLGKYTEAINDAEKSITYAPNSEEAYINYGQIFMSAEKYEKAIEKFSSAIKINPKNDASFYYISVCYNNLGNKFESKKYIDKAILLAPNKNEYLTYKSGL